MPVLSIKIEFSPYVHFYMYDLYMIIYIYKMKLKLCIFHISYN